VGRLVRGVAGDFVSPAHVAVDGTTGDVWVGDSFTGDVTVLNTSGDRRVITSLLRPAGLAIDPLDHTLWVCDEQLDEVAHFLPSGAAATPPRVGPLDLPLDVAVDAIANLVWVGEHGDPSLRTFRRNGVSVFTVEVPRPSRVAVDSVTHDAWVTSFDRGLVVRVSAAGFATDTVAGLRGPIGVAVDSRRGAIWIADALADQVVVVDRTARIVRRIGGLAQAREIAIDLATGNAWVVTAGDGRVVVLSPEGVEVASQAGFAQPYDIALDPGVVGRAAGRVAQGASTSLRAPARPLSTSRTR
jgi:DNA-binding beta-propeller fold protein YncE